MKYLHIKILDIRKVLAAFAWRYEEDSESGGKTLSCDYCARKICLDDYPSCGSRYMKITSNDTNNADPSNKKHTNNLGETLNTSEDILNERFNPFEEHKYFCKWSSAAEF